VFPSSGDSETLVIARRRSRRGNPDGLINALFLAGLLHFVRNDDRGAMNYGSVYNFGQLPGVPVHGRDRRFHHFFGLRP
jgi:hypothetical protein